MDAATRSCVNTAYLLSSAVSLVPMGKTADITGRVEKNIRPAGYCRSRSRFFPHSKRPNQIIQKKLLILIEK